MRIDNIEAIAIEVPLQKVFSGSGYRIHRRGSVTRRGDTAIRTRSPGYSCDR